MGFFTFINWFNSSKRKEYIKNIVNDILHDESIGNEVDHMIYSNKTLVVIFKDGSNVIKNVSKSVYEDCSSLKTKKAILNLINPLTEEESDELSVDESNAVKISNALDVHEDFTSNSIGEYFYKDVKVPLPPIVKAEFISLIEQMNANELKNDSLYKRMCFFWLWLSTNPIQNAINDTLRFIKKNNIPITENGLMVTFRRVSTTTNTSNHKYTNFITNNYLKIKGWKKSPKSYNVYVDKGSNYHISLDKKENMTLIGNLYNLYSDIKLVPENVYTDNYTKSKKIVFGEIYREDEDLIDLNNQVDCGAGLHSGGISFLTQGCGNVGAICLLNPSKVRSVPLYDNWKIRSSELFMLAVCEDDKYYEEVMKENIVKFEEVYCDLSIDELEKLASSNTVEKLYTTEKKEEILKSVKQIKSTITKI